MTIELARALTAQKPWGVTDARPWSSATSAGVSIGEISYERRDRTAPAPALLLKVLLTNQSLSIQVHPDDDTAHAMGLPNGKTEAWFVLRAEPGASVALGLKQTMTPLQLRTSIHDRSIADRVAWRTVWPGDAIAVPAGTIHAIGAGLVIAEIQQRSDTTFRLFDYGSSRDLHIESALAAAHIEPAELQLWPERLTDERTVLVQNPHFVFERIELLPGSSWCLQAANETWILFISGSATAGSFLVAKGDALFLEADRIELGAGANGVVALVAYVGAKGPITELLQRSAVGSYRAFEYPPTPELSPFLSQSGSASSYKGTRP